MNPAEFTKRMSPSKYWMDYAHSLRDALKRLLLASTAAQRMEARAAAEQVLERGGDWGTPI